MTPPKTPHDGETPLASESAETPGRLLILMRHAKSDWADESLSDHDRPLNRRGRGDAPRMAQWLVETGAIPDRILCSSAERTRETVDLMLPLLDGSAEVWHSESLYLSTPETILGNICGDGGDARALMVVAHNPGMSHLVSAMADRPIDMPTAAIAVFRAEVEQWSELRFARPVTLTQLMRPKEL